MSINHRPSEHGRNDGHNVRDVDTKVETPELYSVFSGEVASVTSYGAFVKIPGYRKNGLVHKSQISATGQVEEVSEVIAVGDHVFCKVISLGEEDDVKISLSMKVVNQGNGHDLDVNHVQTKQEEQRRKRGQNVSRPRIELGAVLNTVCKKCGTRGHLAQDCFKSPGGKSYDLLPELEEVSVKEQAVSPSKDRAKKRKKKSKKRDRNESKPDSERGDGPKHHKSKKRRHTSRTSDTDSDAPRDGHSHMRPREHIPGSEREHVIKEQYMPKTSDGDRPPHGHRGEHGSRQGQVTSRGPTRSDSGHESGRGHGGDTRQLSTKHRR